MRSALKAKKIVKFVKYGPLSSFNCESTCDLEDVPASIYDRKINAQTLETNHDILRCLSLMQYLLKSRNAPFGASGNQHI